MRSVTLVGWICCGISLGACGRTAPPTTSRSAPAAASAAPAAPSVARAPLDIKQRKRHLKHAIDSHTGFAHLTRGMNTETIAALREAATPADLPVLEELLADDDRIVAMTTAELLTEWGAPGLRALEAAKASADARADNARSFMLDERIRNMKFGSLREQVERRAAAAAGGAGGSGGASTVAP